MVLASACLFTLILCQIVYTIFKYLQRLNVGTCFILMMHFSSVKLNVISASNTVVASQLRMVKEAELGAGIIGDGLPICHYKGTCN